MHVGFFRAQYQKGNPAANVPFWELPQVTQNSALRFSFS